MATDNERVGDLVHRGILLFSSYVALPAPALVAGISAAVITKVLDLHDRRVSEILSIELTLPHVSRVQPDDEQVALFFARNPVFPGLEYEFEQEIRAKDIERLRELYPVLHGALVLKRQIPALLYREELASGSYRSLALQYEQLMRGYAAVQETPDLRAAATGYSLDFLELLEEIYGVVRKETKDKRYKKAFEIIDLIREVVAL